MKDKWIKVVVPVTDIWKKPKFESGRENQAIYGQICRAVKSQNKYLFCYTEDNYSGWIRSVHTQDTSNSSALDNISYVKEPIIKVYIKPDSNQIISRLSYGSVIEYDDENKGGLKLANPKGWVNAEDLCIKLPLKPSWRNIYADLKKFMGVPYLWGGKSGFGIDCSGLVQLIYNFHGCELPRDTKDQILCGKRTSRKNARPGDLVFSPGHVCIYLGNDKILHANTKNGIVNIESLNKKASDYRQDIDNRITKFSRVL